MALEGTLNYLDISHLLQVVGAARKSGVLEIWWEDREARLLFRDGRLIRAESNRVHLAIGTLLVQSHLLTEDQLTAALAQQRGEEGHRRLGVVLCEEFGIASTAIEGLLRHQFERVVYELFSWPGGNFAFHFGDPGEGLDQFHLNPAEFILEVGVQAGLLAQEGVDREQSDPTRVPFVLFFEDREFSTLCRDHWRRRGHRVTLCDTMQEALGCLGEWGAGEPLPVLVIDLPAAGPEGRGFLEEAGEVLPGVIAVVVGESSDPRARTVARARGAEAYARKPNSEDLSGPQRGIHIDVFLMRLDKAVDLAVERRRGQEADPIP